MVVLDTAHVSLLLWADNPEAERLHNRLQTVPEDEQFTTIVTYEEQSRGWLAYVRRARKLSELVEAYSQLNRHIDQFRTIQILTFDPTSAEQFSHLQHMRLGIGTLDLRIAAICLAHNATLLTRNLRDFKKVPGLKVEDWSTP